MAARKAIEYVDLPPPETTDGAALFLLRVLRGSLPAPFNDPPHRHNFQEIIIVQAGRLRHRIDGQVIEADGPTLSLIAKGQVHVVEGGEDLTAWIVRFTDDFLPAGLISTTWNYHTTLFNQPGSQPAIMLQPAELHDLQTLLTLLEAEYAHPTNFQQAVVLRHVLSVLIIRIERIYQRALSSGPQTHDAFRIYQAFVNLLDYEFVQHHDVEFYATALHLAPAKLSKILSRILGKSTKQTIDERIVLEAKRYLHYTDLSIKEVAFALGYSDLFHFSKTFKRITGMSPQSFREQH